MTDSVIETRGLTKHYRFGRVRAVEELSLEVGRGQIFGFLGPNGSGKTTTIGMLLGVVTPTSGEFTLLGREGPQGLYESRQRIGATLETPNFYPYLSGRDNLRVVANLKGSPATKIAEVLATVGLASRAKDRFQTYSLGMKQRLALAATMLGDPELLVLDEPANGLDPEGMREIRDIILELSDQGKTIFLSSHLLWEIQRTCTHVAIIKKGRVVRHGSVGEITAGTAVAELRAPDPTRLLDAVRSFPGCVSARDEEATVIAELSSDANLSALNEFLAGQGIYASHLAMRQRNLEDVFIELTGAEPVGIDPTTVPARAVASA